MYDHPNVKTDPSHPVPDTMKAWILGEPGQLTLTEKPTPVPNRAEVLVRIDAVAICATDLEIIYHGPPAMIEGGMPFNKRFTPGHEYMGTVVALGAGVDEYAVGDRATPRRRRHQLLRPNHRGHQHRCGGTARTR